LPPESRSESTRRVAPTFNLSIWIICINIGK
jgi:hypothetical protein